MKAYTLKQDSLCAQVGEVVPGTFYAPGVPQALNKPIRCPMRQGLILANYTRIQANLYFKF
jgi:hypothetical protein